MQKSTSFLLPLTKLKYSSLKDNGFINSFLGDWTRKEDWGNFIYLLFSKDSDLTYAKSTDRYVEHYEVEDGIMVKYSITEDEKQGILKPFIDGKYSKIDRNFVNKFFSSVTMTSSGVAPSLNYMILTKSDVLKETIEDHLDVNLDDEAEVWSRPEKEDEIYKYNADIE